MRWARAVVVFWDCEFVGLRVSVLRGLWVFVCLCVCVCVCVYVFDCLFCSFVLFARLVFV